MRLLDLFCGPGGAAVGYAAAGFEVLGVDTKANQGYPFPYLVADALAVLRGEVAGVDPAAFDVIHASPPCQSYSHRTHAASRASTPALITEVLVELERIGRPYIVENVAGSEADMPWSVTLCGSTFGLPVNRHRLFVTRPWIAAPAHSGCIGRLLEPELAEGWERATRKYLKPSVAEYERLVAAITPPEAGVAWRPVRRLLPQAIPPAFTKYLGDAMREALG